MARTLKNLEEFRLNIYDENNGVMVEAPTWIEFVHSIPSLKTLQIDLNDRTWKEFHVQLFRENSLPHLENLTISSFEGSMDFKMLMSVSKKITKLGFESDDEELSFTNLAPTDLRGLKMLSFDIYSLIFDMVQWTHIITELEARPEFVVKYKRNWDVETAEKLGKWLSLPNFMWDLIKATSKEEFNRAVQLCINNCIGLNRISFLE